MKFYFLGLLLLIFPFEMIPAAEPLDAFPSAGEGMDRYVITLPKTEHEEMLKVELLVGRTLMLESQNLYFFAGRLETENLPGWGYDRYILKTLGPLASTLMAVDPTAPKVKRFITLAGEPILYRYNSHLPMVIYLPKGVEIKYRIWRADRMINSVPKG